MTKISYEIICDSPNILWKKPYQGDPTDVQLNFKTYLSMHIKLVCWRMLPDVDHTEQTIKRYVTGYRALTACLE